MEQGGPDNVAIALSTEFEPRRGLTRIESRFGFAQVQIENLPLPLMNSRLEVLESIKEINVPMDFLKLTQSGISFLIAQEHATIVADHLAHLGQNMKIQSGQCIVLVQAPNLRDSEGLLARVVSVAIRSGAPIDHVGDMHDRLLIATTESASLVLVNALKAELGAAS